jgi:hypothetical protein
MQQPDHSLALALSGLDAVDDLPGAGLYRECPRDVVHVVHQHRDSVGKGFGALEIAFEGAAR